MSVAIWMIAAGTAVVLLLGLVCEWQGRRTLPPVKPEPEQNTEWLHQTRGGPDTEIQRGRR